MTCRNCKTCGNLKKASSGFELDMCLISGFSVEVTRRMDRHLCDETFSGWVPRPPSMVPLILQALLCALMLLGLFVLTIKFLVH